MRTIEAYGRQHTHMTISFAYICDTHTSKGVLLYQRVEFFSEWSFV